MTDYSKLLDILQTIQLKGKPCKKTVQKMVYLIEESGEDLGFTYGIHYYGPYSSDLDYAIQSLNGYGNLSIDITDRGHIISVNCQNKKKHDSLDSRTLEIINKFGDKSASQLELIATSLYIQRRLQDQNATIHSEDIVNGVKRIKGDKYSNSLIEQSIQDLKKAGYFSL